MAQRILSAVRHAFRDGNRRTHDVHFHNGPAGQPAPCFDARCSSPRLDPWELSPLLFP
jgi:hypothetical protein